MHLSGFVVWDVSFWRGTSFGGGSPGRVMALAHGLLYTFVRVCGPSEAAASQVSSVGLDVCSVAVLLGPQPSPRELLPPVLADRSPCSWFRRPRFVRAPLCSGISRGVLLKYFVFGGWGRNVEFLNVESQTSKCFLGGMQLFKMISTFVTFFELLNFFCLQE